MSGATKRSTGLGRGLAALIPQRPASQAITEIPIEHVVHNPAQPRLHVEDAALEELADSIQQHGVLQPILVQETVEGYRLIAGERRLRAARLAGLERIPAVVRGPITDRQQLELALIENIQRADLDALEEAAAFRRLMSEFGLTQEDVARQVGRARSSVANTLRLLELAPAVQDAVAQRFISEGHGRALAGVSTALQPTLLQVVLDGDLSVRATEALVRRSRATTADGAAAAAPDADRERVETQLRASLGTKVTLTSGAKGGRIIIEYYGADDLGRLVDRLVGSVA